jgi:membrane protein required for colicin V production
MSWLDVVLGLILAASVLTSFRKGLSREIIGLVSVCAALLLGLWLYGSAAGYLLPYLSSPAASNFGGFAIVFCGVMLLGMLLGMIVGKFLKVTGLSFFDHLLGAAFGVVRGLLISVALVTVIMAFSFDDRPPSSVVHSRIAPYVVGAARVAAAMAPHDLKEGFHKNYQRVKSAWEGMARRGDNGV